MYQVHGLVTETIPGGRAVTMLKQVMARPQDIYIYSDTELAIGGIRILATSIQESSAYARQDPAYIKLQSTLQDRYAEFHQLAQRNDNERIMDDYKRFCANLLQECSSTLSRSMDESTRNTKLTNLQFRARLYSNY